MRKGEGNGFVVYEDVGNIFFVLLRLMIFFFDNDEDDEF